MALLGGVDTTEVGLLRKWVTGAVLEAESCPWPLCHSLSPLPCFLATKRGTALLFHRFTAMMFGVTMA
jgi:hypothetical protein